MEKGKVYLVGSGPGDPELLTLKAKRLIENADVILHDQLIGPIISMDLPKNAELIDVGKYAGKHKLSQYEINKLLVEYAKKGKTVVRLKGGDPYLFGRGGEEALYLIENGIEVEVVPGITSAIAVPAYAGIPVTHRDYASMLTIITGHEDPTKEDSALDWNLLAKFDGTLVILMGVSKLEQNVQELLKYNKNPDTHVAIIEKGTLQDQRVTVGKLKNIVEIAKQRRVKPPAIVVIGDVVKLHKELKKPTIAIMRPSRYTEETVKLVEDMGFKPIVFPMIELVDKYDSNFDGFVDRVLQNKSDYVIFTSVNGIDYTLRKIKNPEEFINALNNIKVIAIGPKTKSALEKYNIKVDIVPDKYSSSGLAETLMARFASRIQPSLREGRRSFQSLKEVKGKVIEIVRSSHGDPTLIPNLESNGAIVHETQVYEIKPPKNADMLIKKTLNKEIDIFAFTSTMMVKNFMQTASAMEVKEDIIKILNSKIVTAIGAPTANTLKSYGVEIKVLPKNFTFLDMMLELKEILEYPNL